jgi:hypothetical protein
LSNSWLRHALLVFLIFLPMPIIGTQLHELGHCAVAWAGGGRVYLHYGSMEYAVPIEESMEALWMKREVDLPEWWETAEGKEFIALDTQRRIEKERLALWVSLGGPVSNMLIGTVGLFFLLRLRRGGRREEPLGRAEWVAMIAILFWSRELFLLLSTILTLLLGNMPDGDETRIAIRLGLRYWSVPLLLGVIGGVVCLWALWLYPRRWRSAFVAGGIAGCAAGFAFWYLFAGPLLMP